MRRCLILFPKYWYIWAIPDDDNDDDNFITCACIKFSPLRCRREQSPALSWWPWAEIHFVFPLLCNRKLKRDRENNYGILNEMKCLSCQFAAHSKQKTIPWPIRQRLNSSIESLFFLFFQLNKRRREMESEMYLITQHREGGKRRSGKTIL